MQLELPREPPAGSDTEDCARTAEVEAVQIEVNKVPPVGIKLNYAKLWHWVTTHSIHAKYH
jgi:hypothetical protein